MYLNEEIIPINRKTGINIIYNFIIYFIIFTSFDGHRKNNGY